MKDLDVTNIHCYDFDKDGDVDVLLTFDYLSSSTFSFLVFAENTGKGKFAIHEHSFKTKWAFGLCLDYDNDGYMELLASVQNDEGNDYGCSSVHGLYLFRLDDMKKVEEPSVMQVDATFFYERGKGPGTDWQEAVVSRLDENITVADIDNDGRLEFLADEEGWRLLGHQRLTPLAGHPGQRSPATHVCPFSKPRPQERQTEDCLEAG